MFDVKLQNRVVGKAEMRRMGLYNEIICRCSFPDKRQYRIYAFCGDRQIDLGICVPYEGSFGFQTKIATKSMGEGRLAFVAVPTELTSFFVDVNEEKPFPNFMQLRKGKYQVRDGKPCIIFQE